MTSAILSTISAMLTCFFFMAAGGILGLIWRDRRRFLYWSAMGPQGRADTVLHISLFWVLLIAGYHRALATYSFIMDIWRLPSASTTAAYYLPVHLLSMSGVLWWLCIELCGSYWGGRVWFGLMCFSAAVGSTAYVADGVMP